ncbi:MAG TPA: Ig-like domain repeat protein [Terracidiphilus sp.]|nr:Ig-like domain repeat protein [Terracidiphilus sp.]
MPAFFRSDSFHFAAIHNRFGSCRYGISLLWLLLLACGVAAGQNTTISGTVYDPRGATGLPLPNVLVYASTSAVAPPPSGVQCLTSANQMPTGVNVVSYANTAVDGTFTLQNIPQNASYTIVIQAGKWQRQFSETVGTSPLTGLQLSMPANHTQGNMPYIAIATGSVDGAECVLRDMGISDSEFTDDNQTVNPGGYVHLYRGSSSSGAQINVVTPSETALMNGTSTTPLNSYDMVMFPCQGNPSSQATTTGATNLLNFATAGGRIFATHYSYAWLEPASPYNAQFGKVANWMSEIGTSSTTGTVQENFSDGIFLAEWLNNAGSTLSGTTNEITISNVRTDVESVIAPTQAWVTLDNVSSMSPVMQMTFNVPFGAPAASQCGRVMYNDYHVISPVSDPIVYPKECPSYNNPTYKMSAQEEMLEYALFDLSAFVQPVVVPTVSVTFAPSPLTVKSGDAADQLTANVNSGTTETDSSAVLSFTLPAGLTITGMSDPTGGWICTVATASCSRTTDLAVNTTDSVILTISVASYTTLSSYTGTITATVSSAIFSTNPTFTDNVIFQQVPVITWATPANIVYGTPLSATQLDATSTLAGTYAYSPAAGTVLGTGKQTLNVIFTPTDAVDYSTATASVTLTVVPGTPTITITSSANPIFATAAVSFTASLPAYASSETGSMTFYAGSTAIGTATVSGGSATLTTTSLAAGNQSITASYSGDADYGPATSSAITETVQDFTLAFAGGNGTVTAQPGGQATYSLVVTPVNGALLPGAVTLSASNLPLGMTASFSPATISAGSAATTVTMTITLPGKTANERPRSPFGGGALPVALGLILLPVAGRMRKARARLARLTVLLVICAAVAVGFMGCGAKTAPQNFSFSVTAASGTLSHSLTPGLTVE